MNLFFALLAMIAGTVAEKPLTFEEKIVIAAQVQRGEVVAPFPTSRPAKEDDALTYEQRLVKAANKQREEDLANLPELIRLGEERRQKEAERRAEELARLERLRDDRRGATLTSTSGAYSPVTSFGLGTGSNLNNVYVNGYRRNDGTYVKSHVRSKADSSFRNNYSTKGNTNPRTGKPGTRVTSPRR